MYLHLSSIGIFFLCFISDSFALSYESACCAEFIVGDESKFLFALRKVTILTPLDGIGIVVGYGLLFYARIESEDALCVLSVASSPRSIASSWGVVGYFDLRTCTTVQRQLHPFGG